MKINTKIDIDLPVDELFAPSEENYWTKESIKEMIWKAIHKAISAKVTDFIERDNDLDETMAALAHGAVAQALKWMEEK